MCAQMFFTDFGTAEH